MKKSKRKKVSAHMRYTIAFEQDFKCVRCHEVLKPGYHIDHIIPLCDHPCRIQAECRDNLQAMCNCCHVAKTVWENKNRYFSQSLCNKLPKRIQIDTPSEGMSCS